MIVFFTHCIILGVSVAESIFCEAWTWWTLQIMVKENRWAWLKKPKLSHWLNKTFRIVKQRLKLVLMKVQCDSFWKNIVRRKNWKGRKDRAEKNAQMNGRTILLWKQASGIASKNAVEIASEVQQRFFKEISARTIQRRLKEMGLMAKGHQPTREWRKLA